jgi:hypothetical protein
MSSWSILLRLLLSLALACNSATAAVASVRMEVAAHAHGTPMPDARGGDAVAAMPCHGHEHGAIAARAHHADMHHEEGKRPAPDHCKSDACRWACMHATLAVLPLQGLGAPTLVHARSAGPLRSWHAAPALANLIRPPIG